MYSTKTNKAYPTPKGNKREGHPRAHTSIPYVSSPLGIHAVLFYDVNTDVIIIRLLSYANKNVRGALITSIIISISKILSSFNSSSKQTLLYVVLLGWLWLWSHEATLIGRLKWWLCNLLTFFFLFNLWFGAGSRKTWVGSVWLHVQRDGRSIGFGLVLFLARNTG